MILVMSDDADLHARTVMSELANHGERAVLYDLKSFPSRARLTIRYSFPPDGAELDVPGHGPIAVGAIRAIWWRRPGLFEPPPEVHDKALREFVYLESSEAFSGLWPSLAVRWVNEPQRDRVAHHKPYQLALAQRHGLTVPATCITNDPDAARAFWDAYAARRVITKALAGSTETWRFTRYVTREWMERVESVKHAPVTLQEYVPGVDVRVTVVGDQVFPIEIDARKTASPEDFRPVWREAPIARCTLPDAVERRLRALVAELGLSFAAIDLRRRDDGEHVFLEVNPSGQWLFLEERTGAPITAAVARLLAGR